MTPQTRNVAVDIIIIQQSPTINDGSEQEAGKRFNGFEQKVKVHIPDLLVGSFGEMVDFL